MSQSRINIVTLHGSASSRNMWSHFKKQVSPEMAVHALDLPGYGRSDQGLFAAGEDLVAQVADQITEDSGSFHLVGHSFGGAVAYALADRMPSKVASLCVYEPIFVPEDWRTLLLSEREKYAAFFDLFQQMAKSDATAAMAAFIDFWKGSGSWQGMPEAVQAQLSQQSAAVQRDFAYAFSGVLTSAQKPYSGPSLLIRGGQPIPLLDVMCGCFKKRYPTSAVQTFNWLDHANPFAGDQSILDTIFDHIFAAEGTRSN